MQQQSAAAETGAKHSSPDGSTRGACAQSGPVLPPCSGRRGQLTLSLTSARAPLSTRAITMSLMPTCAAMCSALTPSLVCMLTTALRSGLASSSFTTARLPCSHARCSAVHPNWSTASTVAPWLISSLATAGLPVSTAACSGVRLSCRGGRRDWGGPWCH